ncbi:hypothetical protein BGZ61DRAFT_294622, partial [Ilyonectria robusta]|uniref:uncharacterized protein n=1 Tax=Ilyonectria robusta TaxID=1079257 RepID=UPI001E8DBCE8
ILPVMTSETSVLWSVRAAFAMLLLWPQSCAAPVACSPLSWIPGMRLLPDSTSFSVGSVEQHADWAAMLYDQLRAPIILNAAINTANEPANATLPDGSRITINTTCPTMSKQFGRLPAVTQYQVRFNKDGNVFAGHDCYIFAEATITAGKYAAKGCNVISETSKSYADCSIDRDDGGAKEDWLTLLSLDFMSKVLKYSVMMNFTQPWLSKSLEDYTAGMLTVGYHVAWSGLMGKLGNATEPAKLLMAEDIVSVSIGYEKVLVWLGMNLTLSIAAILAF